MELINLDTAVNMSEKNISEKDETKISINVNDGKQMNDSEKSDTDKDKDKENDKQTKAKFLQRLNNSVTTIQSVKETINKCNTFIRNIIIVAAIVGILYTTADNNISQKKLFELIRNTTAQIS